MVLKSVRQPRLLYNTRSQRQSNKLDIDYFGKFQQSLCQRFYLQIFNLSGTKFRRPICVSMSINQQLAFRVYVFVDVSDRKCYN